MRAPDDMPFAVVCSHSTTCSEKKSGRWRGRKMFLVVSGNDDGLWPSVIDSQVTPKFWIDEAWFTERQTVFSAAESALSRPSGRPTASSEPRTTRCVCRWTRWSPGLADATESEAMAAGAAQDNPPQQHMKGHAERKRGGGSVVFAWRVG
eukprot:469919-Prymnesium_polylepis.2